MAVIFEVVKRNTRGEKKGKAELADVKLDSREAIYNYLWDVSMKYERNKLNYIVESYRFKKEVTN